MGWGRRTTAAAALMAVGITGCSQAPPRPRAAGPSPTASAAPPPVPTPLRTPGRVVAQAVSPARLVPFRSCVDLLARLRREALAEVGPYGLPGSMGGVMAIGAVGPGGTMQGTALAAGPAPMAAAAPGQAAGGPAFSGTNDQEVGVDEPDVVKTDGRLLAVLRQGGVQVVDVSGTHPRQRGYLSFGTGLYDAQLLMLDGRVVALGSGAARSTVDPRPWTDVRVLSLADPDHPRVEREFSVDGSLTAARALDGRVLVVVQSAPAAVWSSPMDASAAASRRALLQNRALVRRLGLSEWLPSVRALRTGRVYRPDCTADLRPQTASGTATTTVVSFDPTSDVPGRQVTIAASGSVVYASTKWVYVTTSPWQAQVAAFGAGVLTDLRHVTTRVHAFDVSDPARPRYVASGSVPGTLIGQYAMSEQDGYLRVASTLGETSAEPGAPPPTSDSLVTVLAPVADRLVPVGQVGGLGHGERIYGVRFLGDLGYVVTFRQTDPLYVLDLSDPRRPRVTAALHLTGYSSYLDPLGDGLLLGVGQEVQQSRPHGTQLSTFDVSDPRAPRLRSRQVFPDGWSTAENDPHALLWWPATRTLVVPLSQQDEGGSPQQPQWFSGVVVLRVDATGGLHEVRRLAPPQGDAAGGMAPVCCGGGMLRSVVVGDQLLVLSDAGVLTSSLDTVEERSWLPYR